MESNWMNGSFEMLGVKNKTNVEEHCSTKTFIQLHKLGSKTATVCHSGKKCCATGKGKKTTYYLEQCIILP